MENYGSKNLSVLVQFEILFNHCSFSVFKLG